MIALILPTYNEKGNLAVLVKKIIRLGMKDVALIIVDDNSPDGTGKIADVLAKKHKNIKVFHRMNERGLGSAIKFGFDKADTNIVGVMDTDLSHDPKILPQIFKQFENGADFVIGSRYVSYGSIKNWPFVRRFVSKTATLLVKPLTGVRDPMSGFFFVNKNVIKNMEINPESCKICLDIIVRGKYKKVVEIPYIFTNRERGKTKILTLKEITKYIKYILYLYGYRIRNRVK